LESQGAEKGANGIIGQTKTELTQEIETLKGQRLKPGWNAKKAAQLAEAEQELASIEKIAKAPLARRVKWLTEFIMHGKGRGAAIARKIAKGVPGFGAFVAAFFFAQSVQAKGVVAGTLDTLLDALVGAPKMAIESAIGEDIIPTDDGKLTLTPQQYNPVTNNPTPLAERPLPQRYQNVGGYFQFLNDLFGQQPNTDENGFGPAGGGP